MSLTDAMSSLLTLFTPAWPLAVRLISFTCLAMGLFICLPFILLIVYDFFLWVWRTIQKYVLSRASAEQRTQRTAGPAPAGSVQKPLSTKFD